MKRRLREGSLEQMGAHSVYAIEDDIGAGLGHRGDEAAHSEDLVRHALKYAGEGLRVLPIHPPDKTSTSGCSCGRAECSSPGKHPISGLVPRGHLDATTDPSTIEEWWGRYPEANIGVVPGPQHFVVDVDPKNGGLESLEQLGADFGPFETRRMQTGSGGYHLWFRSARRFRQRNGLLPGIDIKTERGYVVMPPSRHVAGAYVELNGGEIQGAPTALVDFINGSWDSGEHRVGTRPEIGRVPYEDGKIPEGRRNSTLMSLAGSMRARGMGATAIAAALQAENRDRCTPALPSEEVEAIALSASMYPPGALGELIAEATSAAEDPVFLETLHVLAPAVEAGRLTSPSTLARICELIAQIPSFRLRLLAEGIVIGKLERVVGRPRAENLFRAYTPSSGTSAFHTDESGAVLIRELQATDVSRSARYLVKERVPAGAVGALVADFSMGKTWLAIDLGLSVAFGRPWFGSETQQTPVVFIVAEGNHDFPTRLYGWLVAKGLLNDGSTVDQMFELLDGRVVINKVPVRFDDPDFEAALRGTVEQTGAGLVIVDTFGKTLGRDQSENDNDVANEITGMLSRVAAATGCTTLFTHHVGHSNGGRARGASALEQGLDFEYVVEGKREDFASGRPVRLRARKMRDARLPDPVAYQLRSLSGLEWTPSGSPTPTALSSAVVEAVSGERGPESIEVAVFRFIEENPGCSQGAVRAGVGRRRDEVNAAIAALESKGAIANRGMANRHSWHTEAGWQVGGSGDVEDVASLFLEAGSIGDEEAEE